MKMHFLSGLPRAGSTLLASLLRQNPRFEASIMSPVGRIVTSTLQAMGPDNEADGFVTNDQRERILHGIFQAYYAAHEQHTPEHVVFDNNRRWTANAALLEHLYPGSKIICCVRAPNAIVDSFERLFRKHPMNLSVIYGAQANLTVYNRVQKLMSDDAVVGFALNALRDAWFSDQRKNLVIVDYDELCTRPKNVMQLIHNAINEPAFGYDFENIQPIPGAEQFDRDVNTPGLHDLKPKIVYEKRTTILPHDLWNNLPAPFWAVNNRATRPG